MSKAKGIALYGFPKDIGGGGGPSGDGLLLEDGSSFFLLEDGSSFLLLE